MTKYQLKGINSDSEVCENCGKNGLKRVMWLEALDADGNGTGNVMPVGTTCGAALLGVSGQFSSPEQVAEAAEKKNRLAEIIETAKKMSVEFSDEIAIIRQGKGYSTVRGKAFDANPNRYGMPVRWVKA